VGGLEFECRTRSGGCDGKMNRGAGIGGEIGEDFSNAGERGTILEQIILGAESCP